MKSNLAELESEALQSIASSTTRDQLEIVRDDLFGRKKGKVTEALKNVKNISDLTERKQFGVAVNILKQNVTQAIDNKVQELAAHSSNLTDIDPTLPATAIPVGHLHPLRQVQQELVDVFYSMGFMVLEGNEVENELFCFEYLNIPDTHPARDLQDTFYVATNNPVKNVLRTHTSNMQVRTMQKFQPPLRAVVPGRVFRNEAIDASHEHTFYQMEGFVVDTDISVANLTYVLKTAMSKLLAQDVKIRLRPGYFPYVEPGFEADCSCTNCGGKGCSVCKHTGWVEMLGCGMIHPKVFESAGYEAGKYTGFAFGIGINRLAMMKYGINDIRWFMKGDKRFLDQF